MKGIFGYIPVILSTLHAVSAIKTIKLDNEFIADTKAARDLIASSRSLEDYGYDYGDSVSAEYLAQYSIKLQNCHEVTQWHAEYQNSDTTKIVARRLVRFRMCPISSCNDNKSTGCSSKYGDFIVDINTFVYYYLLAKKAQDVYTCEDNVYECQTKCYDDDNGYCLSKCYQNYGIDGGSCYEESDDDDENDVDEDYDDEDVVKEFDAADYAQCTAYDGFGDGAYYIGPYCGEESSNIYLALFTDDACTSFSGCDNSCFYDNMGFYLPYADESIVSTDCVSCSDGPENPYYYTAPLGACEKLYTDSGKCETKMNIDTTNDSACSYIDGMKFIRDDGVITATVRKSKLAAMTIGLSSVCAVLLGFYVHVLHTKLSRARFNLSSSSSGAVL